MARPQKMQQVDYFPHICKHGKTMFIIEQRYGNDGYAFWFKLLELIGAEQGHYLDTNKPDTWEFIQAKTRLSGDTCTEILTLLAKLEAIDKDLWDDSRIIWCQNFVDNIADVYRKRTTEIPVKPGFRSGNPADPPVSVTEMRQSKVKESKEKEREPCSRVSETETPEPDTHPIPGPSPEPDAEPEPYSTADHEWQMLVTTFPPRDGRIHDPDLCKQKFLGMPPPVRQQVLIGARHYRNSREVADGVVMHLTTFLSGRFLNWQASGQPLGGGNGRSPTQELLDAIRDPSNDTQLRCTLSLGANALFQAKKLPWPELKRRILECGESL